MEGEPTLQEVPLRFVKDFGDGWEAVLDEPEWRSFSAVKRKALPPSFCENAFQELGAKTQWKKLTNAQGKLLRSTAWYVDDGCSCDYTYGRERIPAQPMPDWLRPLVTSTLTACGLPLDLKPNSVNLNLYEDGSQFVAWHADDDPLFCGKDHDCCVLSVSFGATRTFEIAQRFLQQSCDGPVVPTIKPFRGSERSIQLSSGDILTMEGLFQKHYVHRVAPASEPSLAGPRINMTLRWVMAHKRFCEKVNDRIVNHPFGGMVPKGYVQRPGMAASQRGQGRRSGPIEPPAAEIEAMRLPPSAVRRPSVGRPSRRHRMWLLHRATVLSKSLRELKRLDGMIGDSDDEGGDDATAASAGELSDEPPEERSLSEADTEVGSESDVDFSDFSDVDMVSDPSTPLKRQSKRDREADLAFSSPEPECSLKKRRTGDDGGPELGMSILEQMRQRLTI